MNLENTAAIILAGGRGTRIKAKTKNKVAFRLNGEPMILHTYNNLKQAGIGEIIVVVGFQAESVKKALGNKVKYAVQEEQLGTGHAVNIAIPYLSPNITTVLTISGDDSAFYPAKLYQDMVKKREEKNCDLLFLTIHKENPEGLGRIIRDPEGKVLKIVEEKNASEVEKKIQEINTGFYCFDRNFLETYIDKIQTNLVSGEYYLTDMIEIARENNKKIEAFFVADGSIWHGVNTRSDFAQAQAKLKHDNQ